MTYFYKTSPFSQKLPFDPIYKSDIKINPYSIVNIRLRGREKQAILLDEVDKPSFKCENIISISEMYFQDSYIKIIKFMSKYYFASMGEIAGLFTPFENREKTTISHNADVPKLIDEQKNAFKFISKHQISLLFGDTGSGKTEIYINVISEHIKKNKSAILIMPEISLTPQIEKRLQVVFGNLVCLWHSKINKKQKNQTLEKIKSTNNLVVLGARSALFLPVNNLSLIIVDEEHDDSYKTISSPFIQAKDMAIYMAKSLNIQALLGSATPSLNSYEKLPYFRLRGNFHKSNNDMIFKTSGISDSFFYIDHIKDVLSKGEQVIIFVPTRGNFKYVSCMNCDATLKCDHCDVSMSVYHKQNLVKCHYCGYIKQIQALCSSCGFDSLSMNRMGTIEVSNFLKEHIKDANIEIFDRDNITSNTKLKKILKDFNENKINILVGTQMLSKGHDYHNVSLSIILDIDRVMNIADYQSRSNAISLFLQVAGRSGRKNNGRVITHSKNQDFFQLYLSDYELFLKDEKIFRQDLYPPYKHLARLIFSGTNQKKLQDDMKQVISKINPSKIVGSGECPINKIKSKYRYFILLRDDNIKSLLNTVNISHQNKCSIDINPTNFT